MSEPYITFETATHQYNALREEIRHIKARTLIALLASSILVFYLLTIPLELRYYRSTFFLRAGVLVNAISWLFWCYPSYISLVRSLWTKRDRDLMKGSLGEQEELLKQYQYTFYEYRRLRLIGSIVEVLVALQFFAMGIVFVLSMYY